LVNIYGSARIAEGVGVDATLSSSRVALTLPSMKKCRRWAGLLVFPVLDDAADGPCLSRADLSEEILTCAPRLTGLRRQCLRCHLHIQHNGIGRISIGGTPVTLFDT
jgi:hypothetical protein